MEIRNYPGSGMVFPLRKGPGPIVLFEDFFRHPEETMRGGERETRYEDVTHLVLTRRGIRLATDKTVYQFDSANFAEPEAVERLEAALMLRIGDQPDGRARLARMSHLNRMAERPGYPVVCMVLTLICVSIFLLGGFNPIVRESGLFSKDLFLAGDWWRIVTGNLLHHNFGHLFFNGLALVAIGALVEWPLGKARTLAIMLMSGLAAMGAGVLAGYHNAVGASGIATGLVGAVLWMELRFPQDLPAWWRIPRRLFFGILILECVISLAIPIFAAASHIFGFIAGFLTAALMVRNSITTDPLPVWVRPINVVLILVVLASVGVAGKYAAENHDRIWGVQANRLLTYFDEEDHPVLDLRRIAELNEVAWMIATEGEPTEEDLAVALRLVEKAVELTERKIPEFLDTLAEVLFVLERAEEAVEVINEAILMQPGVSYYAEQRKRFLGERAADDRPEPEIPTRRPPADEPESPQEDADEEGTMV